MKKNIVLIALLSNSLLLSESYYSRFKDSCKNVWKDAKTPAFAIGSSFAISTFWAKVMGMRASTDFERSRIEGAVFPVFFSSLMNFIPFYLADAKKAEGSSSFTPREPFKGYYLRTVPGGYNAIPNTIQEIIFSWFDSFDSKYGQKKNSEVLRWITPDKFARTHCLILHGDPGVGKTKYAHTFANEFKDFLKQYNKECDFYYIPATDFLDRFQNGGVSKVNELRDMLKTKGRPAILCIDEADNANTDSEKNSPHNKQAEQMAVATNMLVDSIVDEDLDVLVINATNFPEVFAKTTISRSKDIKIELPNLNARTEYLAMKFQEYRSDEKIPYGTLQTIARQTEGFSFRDLDNKVLESLFNNAKMEQIKYLTSPEGYFTPYLDDFFSGKRSENSFIAQLQEKPENALLIRDYFQDKDKLKHIYELSLNQENVLSDDGLTISLNSEYIDRVNDLKESYYTKALQTVFSKHAALIGSIPNLSFDHLLKKKSLLNINTHTDAKRNKEIDQLLARKHMYQPKLTGILTGLIDKAKSAHMVHNNAQSSKEYVNRRL